jgi:hypothetical protein
MYIFAIACLSVLTLMFSDFAQKVARNLLSGLWNRRSSMAKIFAASAIFLSVATSAAFAQGGGEAAAGEANLTLPDLSQVQFLGVNGHKLVDGRHPLLHLWAAVWIGHL